MSMGERLTDEQVTELVSNAAMVLNVGRGEASYVQTLAVEVQQSRARRCDNCANGDSLGDTVQCNALISQEQQRGILHPLDWFCADFTAKE
jgi:hypothetical protein